MLSVIACMPPFKNCSPKLRGHKKYLQYTVHVTSGSLSTVSVSLMSQRLDLISRNTYVEFVFSLL